MKYLPYFIVFAFITGSALGQQTSPHLYTVTGTIKDPKGAVIGGLQITGDEGEYDSHFTSTDINGIFKIRLTAGDHILTVDPLGLYNFRAFIKITETGPNPDNVEFIVDPSRVCCVTASGENYPKPIALLKPSYPPAAKAVWGHGQVIVRVKINREGRVLLAEAENGHPLLRSSAIAAARGSTFEPSENEEREARLTYIFILDDEKLVEGISRYSDPFRVDVVMPSRQMSY